MHLLLLKEKRLVAVSFDENYEVCATKLIRSIRNKGNWTQDITAIVPTNLAVSLELGNVFSQFKVNVFRVEGISRLIPRNMTSTFNKLLFFTKIRFRVYSAILYLDSDGRVNSPLEPLFAALHDSDAPLLMRENGAGIGKRDLYRGEFTSTKAIENVVANTRHPGSASMLLVNTRKIPHPANLSKVFKNIWNEYRDVMLHADQTILNIVFRKDYKTFAPCLPVKVVDPDSEQNQRHWYIRHCVNKEPIYFHHKFEQCWKDDDESSVAGTEPVGQKWVMPTK
jgi:hypothetical protein